MENALHIKIILSKETNWLDVALSAVDFALYYQKYSKVFSMHVLSGLLKIKVKNHKTVWNEVYYLRQVRVIAEFKAVLFLSAS